MEIDYKKLDNIELKINNDIYPKMQPKATQDIQEILAIPRGKYFVKRYNRYLEFNDDFFNKIIKNFKYQFEDKTLTPPFIDENHNLNGSYGKIKNEYRITEDGLYIKIQLNKKGKKAIKDEEFSYISPGIYDITDNNKNLRKNVLIALSLTNIPAIMVYPTLQEQIKLNYGGNNEMENKIDFIELKRVTNELDLSEGSNVNLITNKIVELKNELAYNIEENKKLILENSDLKTKLENSEVELNSYILRDREDEVNKILDKAQKEYKILPSQREFLLNMGLDDKIKLEKYIETCPTHTEMFKQETSTIAKPKNNLSDDEKAIMLENGLDPNKQEDIDKVKKIWGGEK